VGKASASEIVPTIAQKHDVKRLVESRSMKTGSELTKLTKLIAA